MARKLTFFRRRTTAVLLLFAGLYLVLATGSPLCGQTPPTSTKSSGSDSSLTTERIEQLLRELEADKTIDEETRAKIVEAYRSALKDLQSAAELTARQQSLVSDAESVATRVAQIKQQLESIQQSAPTIDTGSSLPELEQLLPQLELQLANQKKTRKAAESESQVRSQRRKEIRARMVAVQEKIAETQAQLTAAASTEISPLTTARGLQLSARRLAFEKELPALEAELAKYDAEDATDLVRLQIDHATRMAAATEKRIELLQKQIKSAREAAAELSVRKARLEAIAADESLKQYADRNQELAEKAKAVAQKLADAEHDLKAATDVHEELVRKFSTTRKKVDSVGLTSSVGALLRKQRSTLPDVTQRQSAVAMRQSLINDIQYELFEYEDERQELGELDEQISQIVAASAANGARNLEVLEAAAEDLLARKSEYLDALIRNSGQYFDTLIELDTTDQQVISLAAEYEHYIDERVLWIRSGRALTTDFSLDPSDTWLIDPTKWAEVGSAILVDARRRFPLYLIVVFPLLALLVRGRAIRRQIGHIGEMAQKANCRTIAPTFRTLGLTAIISLALPAFLVFLGWRIHKFAGEPGFLEAVGDGLRCLGLLLAALEIVRQVCRPNGLGESHFRWPRHATMAVRRQLRLLTFIALPLAFVTATLSVSDPTHGRDALERLSFLTGMGIVAVVTFRLLMPSCLLREYYAAHKGGWLERFKYVWALVAACVPLSLACLAFAGYYYTAQELFWRLFSTCVFVVSMIVIRSLFFRMLLLRRRNLSIEQSRQRAAAALANGDQDTSHAVAGIVTEDHQADISTHSIQTRRLISTGLVAVSIVGLWLIWVQVLPALAMLDNYPLWPGDSGGSMSANSNASSDPALPLPMATADSSVASSTGGPAEVPTLSDLALAILIAFVTFVLFRNGPGLLEISLLQQLPVDASVRYAITTLVSYAIILVGTIMACSTIGLQWSQIQWLATALTFGLAFGLQEMFANFVAGLIILLERPIRVGDIVTVDDVTGVVSRIRIRATSITNWDRKEYVVPNKEFITGRLLNWTLTDKTNRVCVNVGVAYGSDTERAREILLAAANDHPLILKDPPSVATFEGFGDNSLNLVLRTYLPNLDNRLEVIHQLHTTIDKAFRAEGIEIAFPQRDLHIRQVPAALGMMLDGDQASESQRGAA